MSQPHSPDDPRPLTEPRPKVRLYVDQPLGPGQQVALSQDQGHYVANVMRMAQGEAVALFNGRDGEWRARIASLGKRGVALTCEAPTAPQGMPPDLWLLFAPVKKARTDLIVEKAVELGAARVMPVLTDYTNAERLRPDKARAHAIEAAEQCGATFVPEVVEAQPLARLLAAWPEGRRLWWADESLPPGTAPDPAPAPAAILIGPEGGFSPAERARLATLPFVRRMSLGPRILRAETAALAALVLWQAAHGDWRG